jgi:hypothetical protein
LGAVNSGDGSHEVKPKNSTTYTLEARNAAGDRVTREAGVEVLEPVEIVSFSVDKPVVYLLDEKAVGSLEGLQRSAIILRWDTKGATEVTLELVGKPEGSRAEYPATPQPASGSLVLPVNVSQFTRYGTYYYQLVAKGYNGPRSVRIPVELKQR